MNLPSASQIHAERNLESEDLETSSSVPVIDIDLALNVLEHELQWRFYLIDFLLGISLFGVLVVYALYARFIPLQYYIGQGVWNDLVRRPFLVETSSFDLNTPLNTSENVGYFSNYDANLPINNLTNLNDSTLEPTILPFTKNFQFSEGPTRLPFAQARHFSNLRQVSDFTVWMDFMLNESMLFQGRSFVMIGQVRVRQLRSNLPGEVVSSSAQVQNQYFPPNSACAMDSALQFQTPSQLAGNNFPPAPNVRASRLDFYYPSSGFAFDFPPNSSSAETVARWNKLSRDCDWISNNFTSALFVSFTGYDYTSDAFVFAQLVLERFPAQGSILTREGDVRVFRIPGSVADSFAQAWRISLCVISLSYLIFYLIRFVVRTHQRFRKRYRENWWDRWLVLNVFSLCLIQASVWLSLSATFDSELQNLQLFQITNSYVSVLDNVSFNEKLADLLLGLCLLLESIKLLQLLQGVWPSLVLPYTICNRVAVDLFSWAMLLLSFFCFFAIGAVFIFGSWLGMFSKVLYSFASTLLLFSKVPQYSSITDSSTFWLNLEEPWYVPLVWEANLYFRTYQSSVIFSFEMWFSLVVLIVFWVLRNLLLGIVAGVDLEELEVAVRPWKMREMLWKVAHQNMLNHFCTLLSSRTAFVVTPSLLLSQSFFPEVHLPEWYQKAFLLEFEYHLKQVDGAILQLLEEEQCFALSWSAIQQAIQLESLDETIEFIFDACREEFSMHSNLYFISVLSKEKFSQSSLEIRDLVKKLVEICPSNTTWFDVRKFSFYLVVRISPILESSQNNVFDTSEMLLTRCQTELELDFSTVSWDDLVLVVGQALKESSIEELVWILASIFPTRIINRSVKSSATIDDLKEALCEAKVDSENNEFNPRFQQEWDDDVSSGEFALTLCVIASLRAQYTSDILSKELFDLEQNQVELEKNLLYAQQSLANKKMGGLSASSVATPKHGIEFHPKENKYRVHFFNSKTYIRVGDFKTQQAAEAALAKTIEDQEDIEHYSEEDINVPAVENEQGNDISKRNRLLGAPFSSMESIRPPKKAKRKIPLKEKFGFMCSRSQCLRCYESGRSGFGLLFQKTLHRCKLWVGWDDTNTFIYDSTDGIWRDNKNKPVPDLVLKPKTIVPLAGNTYEEIMSAKG